MCWVEARWIEDGTRYLQEEEKKGREDKDMEVGGLAHGVAQGAGSA